MSVERIDYTNEDEFQQALQAEEAEAQGQWEAEMAEKDAAQAQFEMERGAQEEAEANIPNEESPDDLPF